MFIIIVFAFIITSLNIISLNFINFIHFFRKFQVIFNNIKLIILILTIFLQNFHIILLEMDKIQIQNHFCIIMLKISNHLVFMLYLLIILVLIFKQKLFFISFYPNFIIINFKILKLIKASELFN